MLQCKPSILAACLGALAATASTAAFAATDTRDVVRDVHGQVVLNSFGNCVRTQWSLPSDPCGAKEMAQATETRAIAPTRRLQKEERTLYFEFDKSRLTEDSKDKLNSLATVLKGNTEVKSASIVGYADPIGTTTYNEQLSKRRAVAVQNYLTSRGYLNTRLAETRWLGESAPKANCPESMKRAERIACLQPDRRVEVEIDFFQGAQATR